MNTSGVLSIEWGEQAPAARASIMLAPGGCLNGIIPFAHESIGGGNCSSSMGAKK